MVTIAVDAMGSDHAPKPEVEGAIRAVRTLGVKVILVGREEVIRRELAQHDGVDSLPIEVVHASEHVTMEDSAAKAMRAKRDSSMRVASRMVRDKIADGFVSAGNDLTRAATPLLKELKINFIGNVEGRDIYTGKTDVVVCDGFIGNVALKVSEGVVDIVSHMLKESLEATITRKIGYVLSRTAYSDFKKRVDYSEIGGAPLLGVQGVCIVCHGRSNANAIKNAIRVAAEFSRGQINHLIESELGGRKKVT